MILLFGAKANKTASSQKNNNVKNTPVENSGILAMGISQAKSLLTIGEFDTYISSNPVAIDFSLYSNCDFQSEESFGFMSEFSSAISILNDSGIGDCGFSTASSCSFSSSGAFSSVG